MSIRKTMRNERQHKLAIKPRGFMPPPTKQFPDRRKDALKRLSRETKVQVW